MAMNRPRSTICSSEIETSQPSNHSVGMIHIDPTFIFTQKTTTVIRLFVSVANKHVHIAREKKCRPGIPAALQ